MDASHFDGGEEMEREKEKEKKKKQERKRERKKYIISQNIFVTESLK